MAGAESSLCPWHAAPRQAPGRRECVENRPVSIERIITLNENKEILNEWPRRFLALVERKGEVGRAGYVRVFGTQFSLTTLYWDLRDLREPGLVVRRRRGRFSYYRLERPPTSGPTVMGR